MGGRHVPPGRGVVSPVSSLISLVSGTITALCGIVPPVSHPIMLIGDFVPLITGLGSLHA